MTLREPAFDPEVLLRAYRSGLFPMGDPETGEVWWYAPDPRAVLPLDERFRVSRSLARVVRSGKFEVTADQAFDDVIARCSEPAPGRPSSWITEPITHVYRELYRSGWAHSVECWHDGQLAGGLYGVAIGGAFFGESMFTRVRDASKVALVHLVERLRQRGFALLDVQFITPHLERFGAYEISREAYLRRLKEAVGANVSFGPRCRSGQGASTGRTR